MLDDFAAAVRGRGGVLDVGCGPAGHVARYLADQGVDAAGVDLSSGVIEVARRYQPELNFEVADVRELPAADGSLAGIIAFYSVIHLPAGQVPIALGEFRRVLQTSGCCAEAAAERGRPGSHRVRLPVTATAASATRAAMRARRNHRQVSA